MQEPVIIIYAAAKRLINTFTKREKNAYEYMLTLLKSDAKNLRDIEIAQRAGDDKHQVEIGIHKVHAMHDRVKYILNTFGLHANIHEGEIIITTLG